MLIFGIGVKCQQVYNAATANTVYYVLALRVKLKHDQLHSLNFIKWTWINFECLKTKECNILFTRNFFPKMVAPKISGPDRPNSSNMPKAGPVGNSSTIRREMNSRDSYN